MPSNNFYVYEHWRSDTNCCFYVGKGRKNRAGMMTVRNKDHKEIQATLAELGSEIEIKFVAKDLSEADAFAMERERISFWRNQGIVLANRTNGGEGPSGNQYRLGAILSAETRKKIAARHIGRKHTDAHRKAVSKAVSGEKNGFYGKKHSAETRAKVAEANRRRIWSDESRRKSAMASKGHSRNGGRTWKLSEETKRRQSAGAKLRWVKWREARIAAQHA